MDLDTWDSVKVAPQGKHVPLNAITKGTCPMYNGSNEQHQRQGKRRQYSNFNE